MFKLNRENNYFSFRRVKAISPFDPYISQNRTFFDGSIHNRKIHILKKDSKYIPIISAINSDDKVLNINKDIFAKNVRSYIKSNLFDSSSTLREYNDINYLINKHVEDVYDEINPFLVSRFSRNIPVYGKDIHDPDILISDLPSLILNNQFGNVFGFEQSKGFISTFYYAYNDKLLLTLVVKKDKLVDFKKDLVDKNINPENVEIWVDKELINESDRKKFHKYIRETLMMKLAMEGFKIKEKDDIMSELEYRPEIKINSFDKIETIKENINKFLIAS